MGFCEEGNCLLGLAENDLCCRACIYLRLLLEWISVEGVSWRFHFYLSFVVRVFFCCSVAVGKNAMN